MKTSRLLAACAALTLIAAACGDDDDDAASDDTSAETIAAPAGGAGTEAPAATDGTASDVTVAGGDDTVAGVPTLPGSGASEEQVADCQLIFTSLSDQIEDAPADPEVGEEISDEYKDTLRDLVDTLEGLDLQTDEVRAGVDSLVDFANEVIDADEWTEDMQASSQDAFTPLTNVCAATFAEVPTST